MKNYFITIWSRSVLGVKEVKRIERKTIALTLVTLTALVTIIGALTTTSFATETTTNANLTDAENQTTDQLPFVGIPKMLTGEQGFCRGHRGGPGDMRNIEISTEYTETVNTILEADTDVQTLLAEGYNVTHIMPEVKTVIEADATVTTKATTAIVTLQNGTSGLAVVNIDISQAKVTKITILTKTVIDKTTS